MESELKYGVDLKSFMFDTRNFCKLVLFLPWNRLALDLSRKEQGTL